MLDHCVPHTQSIRPRSALTKRLPNLNRSGRILRNLEPRGCAAPRLRRSFRATSTCLPRKACHGVGVKYGRIPGAGAEISWPCQSACAHENWRGRILHKCLAALRRHTPNHFTEGIASRPPCRPSKRARVCSWCDHLTGGKRLASAQGKQPATRKC